MWDFLIRLSALVAVIYSGVYVKKNYHKIKPKPIRDIFKYVIESNRIKYLSIFKSILLPIVLTGIFWIWLYSIWNVNECVNFNLDLFGSFTITPIFEEIIYRGILLNILVFFINSIYNKFKIDYNAKWNKFAIMTFSLFFSSIIFSVGHIGKIDLRYIGGIIFGFVYLIDDRNLLPAVIAHALNNIIVALLLTCIV